MTHWIVRHWPLLAYILACLIFDGISVNGLHLLSHTTFDWAIIGTTFGVWWGQIVLAVAIAGLSGRSWIEGFFIGLALTLLGLAAFACSLLASGEAQSLDSEELISLALTPSLMLAACLPLFFFRQWRGWRFISNQLQPAATSHPTNQAAGIEDLFLVTAVVAASMVFARIPAVVWDMEGWIYWLYLAGGSLFASAMTAILIAPAGWLVFRIRRWPRLAIALVCLWLLAIGLALAALYIPAYLYGGQPHFRMETVPAVALAGAMMATLLGGLLAFRFSGVALGKRSSQAGAAVATDLSKKPSRLSAANTARALAAGFFIGAALANIPTARLELERRQQEQALDALAQRFSARGGSIGIQHRKLTTLNAWPAMTDAELGQFDLSTVHTLSLADSQVTDAGLLQMNGKLQLEFLNASHTSITADGILATKITRNLAIAPSQFSSADRLRLESNGVTVQVEE